MGTSYIGTDLLKVLHPRFSRGSVQTILPPNKRTRTGRLCSSFDNQIKDLERDKVNVEEHAEQSRRKKRNAEEEIRNLQDKLQTAKVVNCRCLILKFNSFKCLILLNVSLFELESHFQIFGLMVLKFYYNNVIKACKTLHSFMVLIHSHLLVNHKRRRLNAERDLMSKQLAMKDVKDSYAAESSPAPASTVDELHQEISVSSSTPFSLEICLDFTTCIFSETSILFL